MAGALIGIGLVLALLLVSRPGAAGSPLPAAVRFELGPVGELEVTPAPPRPVLLAEGLRPGGQRAAASFRLRNQTGEGLAVALEAVANSTALNGLLRVRAEVGGRKVAETTLEGFQRRPLQLRLASGQGTRLRLEAWLPGQVLSGYQGKLVRVSLDPQTRILGGRE